MAQYEKRKSASLNGASDKPKVKKLKTSDHPKASSKSDKAGSSSSAPKAKAQSKSIPQRPKPVVGDAKSDSDFDGFTSDEEEGGVPLSVENPSAASQPTAADGITKSRESHQKQKELVAARKAAKPNADDIARAKKLWERLRLKSHVEKDERQKLVGELFDIITGRVHDFVFKHDSVRVIQCAVKYSTIAQKKQIAMELKGTFKALAESKYAKFLMAKMITEGDDETKNLIIPEFYGHVRRLINHPEASWILDDIYRSVATKEHKAMLLREFYGPEFAVFKSKTEGVVSSDLSSILKESPEKRKPIMQYLQERINQLIQKKMTGFTILHDAMLQYFLNIPQDSEDFNAFIKLVLGDTKEEETDLLRNLAFTNSGSQIVCLVLAHSTAKDRRQILKSYKEVFEMLAYDKFGHRVIITAFDVIDDTREIVQRVFSELVLMTKGAQAEDQNEKVVALATHQFGHVSLLYPFIGANRKLLVPDTFRLMQKVQNIRKSTSKKDPAVRATELSTSLSPNLLQAIEARAADIMVSSFGCLFITEVIIGNPGENAGSARAVAEAAPLHEDPSSAEHISHSPHAGKMLKSLIAGGRYDKKAGKVIPLDPPLHFEALLLDTIRPYLSAWTLGDGGFTILALLEADWADKEGQKLVKSTVKENKKALQQAVKEGETADSTGGPASEGANKRRQGIAAKNLLECLAK